MNQILRNYFKNNKVTNSVLDFFKVTVENEGEGEYFIKYPYPDGTLKSYNNLYPNKNQRDFTGDVDIRFEVFGFCQLPKSGKKIFITSRERDVLTLHAEGYHAVCLSLNLKNAERIIEILKNKFEEVISVLLNDVHQKYNHKNNKILKIPFISIPISSKAEDVTEYFALGNSKEDFEELIKKGISKFYKQKSYYPASDLRKIISEKDDFIIPGILPKGVMAGLVGGSDSGKSLLALQFAICYVLGKNFLGFEINGKKKVFYCSFEDDHRTLQRRFDKLTSKLSKEERSLVLTNIYITHDNAGIEGITDNHINTHPDTGLIILDTFSELMADMDINSTSNVRGVLRPFHNLLIKQDVTVLFIHHITKSSDRESRISKNSVLGSQGIEAKARVIFGMKKGNQEIRTLSIIKGNEIDDDFKTGNSHQYLKLNIENLWFEKTEYVENSSIKKESREYDWSAIFGDSLLLKSGIINELLQKKYDLNQKAAEKVIHKELANFRHPKLGWYKNPAVL